MVVQRWRCNTTPSTDEPPVLWPESPTNDSEESLVILTEVSKPAPLLDSAAAISQSQNESLDPDWMAGGAAGLN
jgi:hypothetical protein